MIIILTIFNLGLIMLIWKHSSVFILDILTWFHFVRLQLTSAFIKEKTKQNKQS